MEYAWIIYNLLKQIIFCCLVYFVDKVIGFEGKILPGDPSLDGTQRKKTNCTLLNSIMTF